MRAYPARSYLASVSGGSGSLLPRAALEWEGQRFLAGAVPAAEVRSTVGEPARDPVRVYAGLGSARTAYERAELATRELERLGAFERRRLVVASPTGLGWLNPVPIEAEEHMSRGDVATVVLQPTSAPTARSQRSRRGATATATYSRR